MRNMLYYLSMVTVIITLILLGYISYLYFIDGNNILVYSKEPMKVTVNKDNIDVLIEYCRTRKAPLVTYPAYINGIMYNLIPERVAGSEAGCFKRHRLYLLPEDLPNGKYRFQVRNEVEVNSIKKVWVGWVSEEFVVKK